MAVKRISCEEALPGLGGVKIGDFWSWAYSDVPNNTDRAVFSVWSLVKRGINGVYHAVCAKHLQDYLNEYVYRYNRRNAGQEQFKKLLLRSVRST